MKELFPYIRSAFAFIGGAFGYFFGAWDHLFYALLVFVIIDYISGVMCAISDKTLSSDIGFKGICRKVLIFIMVGVANVLDITILNNSCVLRSAVIFFYLSNEGISLLENATHLGLPIPAKLKDVLEQLHEKDGDESSKSSKAI